MLYKSEEEFLAAYNSDEYEKLSMTTDILILSISDEVVDNYRKSNEKYMSVLLVKRDDLFETFTVRSLGISKSIKVSI